MKTYNSQNLPLEHVVKNGRNFLLYNFKVKDTKAKPANPNSPKAIDQWNDFEAGTYFLDNAVIEDIVKTVNKMNIPAVLEINFDLGRNAHIAPIKIPILPAVVEKNIDDSTFIQRYTDFYDDKRTEQLPAPKGVDDLTLTPLNLEEERAKTPYIDIIESNQVVLVKEQIRRLIITEYLYAKSRLETDRDQIPIIEFIEGLNIINEYYDLRQIDPEDIHFDKVSSLSKKLAGAYVKDSEYPDAIHEFSIKLQQQKGQSPSRDVYCLKTPGYHVIGLRCGKNPEQIANIARLDALVAERITNMSKTESIIDLYKRKLPKNPEDFLPKQPGNN